MPCQTAVDPTCQIVRLLENARESPGTTKGLDTRVGVPAGCWWGGVWKTCSRQVLAEADDESTLRLTSSVIRFRDGLVGISSDLIGMSSLRPRSLKQAGVMSQKYECARQALIICPKQADDGFDLVIRDC